MELMSASGIFMKGLPLIKHLNIGGFTDAALCV